MRVESLSDIRGMLSEGDFALDVVYTSPSGSVTATTALVDEGVEVQGGDVQAVVGTHTITLLYEHVPNPVRNATIETVLDGRTETFRVDHVIENDGRIVVLIASRIK